MKTISALVFSLSVCGVPALFAQNSILANLPENSWYEAPKTKMEAVFPPYDESFWGTGGPAMVIDAWGGGAYDPIENQMFLWGGGHNDYYGNEVYVFKIDSLKWERVTEPTRNWSDGGDPNSDGTPNARHTNNGLAFITHANVYFASGGGLNNTSGGCGADLTWTFDYSSNQWENREPSTQHTTDCGNCCAYDTASRRVFWGDVKGLYSYNYDQNSWTKHNDDYFYYQTMVVDSKRRLLLVIGEGSVFAYDIGSGNYTRQEWNTSGDSEIRNTSNPGL
ncbi:MAG: hypothetical protein L0287_14345, partial [Anaerolineae bacterium]|nr:hypothetical protein [Anaerolineae bacterium]